MKMLQGFAFFVMIALVPAIAIAQSASGLSAKVEKVDESAGKVTLDHAALPELDMPATTRVYKVRNSSPPLWQGGSRGAIDAARKKTRTGTPDRRRRQPAPSPAN